MLLFSWNIVYNLYWFNGVVVWKVDSRVVVIHWKYFIFFGALFGAFTQSMPCVYIAAALQPIISTPHSNGKDPPIISTPLSHSAVIRSQPIISHTHPETGQIPPSSSSLQQLFSSPPPLPVSSAPDRAAIHTCPGIARSCNLSVL